MCLRMCHSHEHVVWAFCSLGDHGLDRSASCYIQLNYLNVFLFKKQHLNLFLYRVKMLIRLWIGFEQTFEYKLVYFDEGVLIYGICVVTWKQIFIFGSQCLCTYNNSWIYLTSARAKLAIGKSNLKARLGIIQILKLMKAYSFVSPLVLRIIFWTWKASN